ncbi:MAG: T9SS type A sorting domain-containing protein [Bacteroidetes bacterium]|nr:T9SS type A sorting domain-containing protein [Bacteroidota bacterium]
MKRHVRLLTILLLLLINFKKSNADTYGAYGNLVYRADTVGNTVWVKNFNGEIIQTTPTYGNAVYGCVFDGHFVYVLNIQQTIQSSPTPSYYVSIVVLDTNGNTITTQTRIESSANGYTLGKMLPSFTSGAWYYQRHGPGFTHIPSIVKVDSLGRDVTVVCAWFTSAAEIKCFLPLKDSTYLVAVNGYSTSGPSTQTAAFIKFDDNGNIIWAYCYNIPSLSTLEFKSCVSDEDGNIYAIGKYWVSNSNYPTFGLKVNSSGVPIIFNTWTSINGSMDHTLNYRNREIIDLYLGTEIHFDTLFEDSCLISTPLQCTFSVTATSPLSTGGSNISSFFPSDSSFFLNTVTYPEYCSTLLNTNEIERDEISIFPNPSSDRIQILNKSNNTPLKEIKVFDTTGREVYSNFIFKGETIDISKFSNGMYYLIMKRDNKLKTIKFIKQ